MTVDSLAARAKRLLDTARYLTLATAGADGDPWVATLEYVWFADPLRFVFGSATTSWHSRHLEARPQVSGSMFVTESPDAGAAISSVDGAQFTGRCAEISPDRLDEYYTRFYETTFPDPQQRAQWQLPVNLLQWPAPHRLYAVEVERWWLIDTRTWADDRIDRRIEMPLDAQTLTHLSPGTQVKPVS